VKIVNNLFLKFNTKWLLAGVLMTLASSFGQTYFISIFAAEICKEFRLSHGVWGGIYTLGTGVSAIVIMYRYGCKSVCLVITNSDFRT